MNVTSRAHIVSRLAQEPAPAVLSAGKPAGVVIPIVLHDEPTVLLTLRTEHLPTHAGQVCFPGGRFHETDESLTESALRELEEETGISRDLVEVGGYLEPYPTITGYTVLPVVGFMNPGFELRPNILEVAEAFEVPLAFLLDPRNRESRIVIRDGKERHVFTYLHDGHRIWGATAGMIVNLAGKLTA